MNPQALTASAKVEALAWAWRRGIRVLEARTVRGTTVVTVVSSDDVVAAAPDRAQIEFNPTPRCTISLHGKPVRFEVAA